MKWRRVKNRDVIDRRGASPSRGGGMGLPLPGGRGGRIGGGAGLIVLLIVIGLQVLGGGGSDGTAGPLGGGSVPGSDQPEPIPPGQDPERELKDFSAFVFTKAQKTWSRQFAAQDSEYENAQLVLFRQGVDTGCGFASSAVGPFYCPADQRVYLDLSFYDALANQLGAPGDFAWAYVVAHEMGHHVQRQAGTEAEVRERQSSDPGAANELSIRLELQADCYAGVWASTVRNLLEKGDLREAFTATEAIGDDRLQSRGGGEVDPDTFTHGSSEQRERWFRAGYDGGDPGACDTFGAGQV